MCATSLCSFARGVLTPIELPPKFWRLVKLARAPYLCGWPCGDFGLLLKKKKSSSVLVIGGERERVEKDPSLVDSSTGTRPSRAEPR